MRPGNQLNAPIGFGELQKDMVYHLVRNEPRLGRVFLVSFNTERPGAKLTVLSRAAFEAGLASGGIVHTDATASMPPWLEPLEGLDLHAMDVARTAARNSHRDQADARLAHLYPAIQNLNEILSAEDPIRAINRFAREATPRQNETRFRVWFFVYLAFGQRSLALWSRVCLNGRGTRDVKPGVKLGRPSHKGAAYGYPCDAAMKEKIKRGYTTFFVRGQPAWKAYALVMTRVFGCRVATTESGDKEYVHPAGEPFPSRHQWTYWCEKFFGVDELRRERYGEQRHRHGLASSGRFSQCLSNLMEKVEADAYSTYENPRGFTDDHVMPKLYVVRMACVGSGVLVGIGFSLGSETDAAYRMALFCCAIGKKRFCALFGIDIAENRWPCIGLPTSFVPDRGPGASERVARALRGITAERDLPPSYTPQSHGTVESSHPRDQRVDGCPTYVRSEMNPVALARREIYQLLADNQSSSALDRLTPDMLRENVLATPLGVWNYLDQRGRNDAQGMAFDDAVRAFGKPIELDVIDGRLYLQKMVYSSAELCSTGILNKLRWCGKTSLPGYAFELCVRHLWVVVDNRLIEVDAQLPIYDDDEQTYVSLEELKRYADAKRYGRTRIDDNRAPAWSEAVQESDDAVGQRWHSGQRRSGKAKARTPAAQREVRYVKRSGDLGGR